MVAPLQSLDFTPMKPLHHTIMAYISPNLEVYRAEVGGVLCTSTSCIIIDNGYITEDEDVWEK